MSHQSTALVTGATAGIGRATAFALGRAGWRLGVCSRNADGVRALLRDLHAEGITAVGRPADVAKEMEVHTWVRQVESELGPVDTLVNNAGIAVFKPFAELTLEDWDRTIATNVRSLFLVTREVLPGMRQRREGAVVNVASLAGRNGVVGGTAYAASKHAVLGFSRSLMLEVRDEHVRVITICPGSVDTALMRDQSMIHRNPRRILKPEDVAEIILAALRLPERALVSELDVRPTSP